MFQDVFNNKHNGFPNAFVDYIIEGDEEGDEEGSDEEVEDSDNQPANSNSMEIDDDEGSDDEKEDKNRLSMKEIVIETSQFLKDYKFDSKKGAYCELVLRLNANTKKVLMINLVEKTLKQTVIHEVKKIQRCFFTPNEAENDTNRYLATDGVNFHAIWKSGDILDLNQIHSNDIAATKKEIASVFAVYGIGVDGRHLSLISDYMTFESGYKPFNRMGIYSNTSPFQQMSFETTAKFLTNSTLIRDEDDGSSPSARIVLGKVVNGGTGSFEVLHSLTTA